MDFEKLRNLKEGNRVEIGSKIYKIKRIDSDAVLRDDGEYANIVIYWMKREEDGKDFVLQIPEEDYEDLVLLLRAIKRDGGWMFNPSRPLTYVKII